MVEYFTRCIVFWRPQWNENILDEMCKTGMENILKTSIVLDDIDILNTLIKIAFFNQRCNYKE